MSNWNNIKDALAKAELLWRVYELLRDLCSRLGGPCSTPYDAFLDQAVIAAIAGLRDLECRFRAENEKPVLSELDGYFDLRGRGNAKDVAFDELRAGDLSVPLDALMRQLGVTEEEMKDYLEFLWQAYNYARTSEARYGDGSVIGLCAVDKAMNLGLC